MQIHFGNIEKRTMILTKKILLISFLFLSCSTWSNTYEDEIIFYEELSPLKSEKGLPSEEDKKYIVDILKMREMHESD